MHSSLSKFCLNDVFLRGQVYTKPRTFAEGNAYTFKIKVVRTIKKNGELKDRVDKIPLIGWGEQYAAEAVEMRHIGEWVTIKGNLQVNGAGQTEIVIRELIAGYPDDGNVQLSISREVKDYETPS